MPKRLVRFVLLPLLGLGLAWQAYAQQAQPSPTPTAPYPVIPEDTIYTARISTANLTLLSRQALEDLFRCSGQTGTTPEGVTCDFSQIYAWTSNRSCGSSGSNASPFQRTVEERANLTYIHGVEAALDSNYALDSYDQSVRQEIAKNGDCPHFFSEAVAKERQKARERSNAANEYGPIGEFDSLVRKVKKKYQPNQPNVGTINDLGYLQNDLVALSTKPAATSSALAAGLPSFLGESAHAQSQTIITPDGKTCTQQNTPSGLIYVCEGPPTRPPRPSVPPPPPNIKPSKATCNDGLDNNKDGLIDSDDPACSACSTDNKSVLVYDKTRSENTVDNACSSGVVDAFRSEKKRAKEVRSLEAPVKVEDLLTAEAERGRDYIQHFLELSYWNGLVARNVVLAEAETAYLKSSSDELLPVASAPAGRVIKTIRGYITNPPAQLWASWIYTPIVSALLGLPVYPGTQL